jgi:hypothetical protein
MKKVLIVTDLFYASPTGTRSVMLQSQNETLHGPSKGKRDDPFTRRVLGH